MRYEESGCPTVPDFKAASPQASRGKNLRQILLKYFSAPLSLFPSRLTNIN